ncbi:MAG: molecular chaperone [Candidatus Dadabacteria bacterium]
MIRRKRSGRKGLRRWAPFMNFSLPQEGMISGLFNEAVQAIYPNIYEFEGKTWIPAVDIYETDDSFVLSSDLPGINKGDFQIELNENILVIKGQRKREDLSKDNCIRSERQYGAFLRSFVIPSNADVDKIKATYKEGVLQIVIPKKEEVRPKQIKVS